MPQLSDELRQQAVDAFRGYERVFLVRIAKRPEGRLDQEALASALATDDSNQVREFIRRLEAGRLSLLESSVA